MKITTGKLIRSCAVAATLAVVLCTGQAATKHETSLYDELGGNPGLTKLVGTFVGHLFSDPHIAPFFDGVDPKAAQQKLGAQFCDLAGGPCKTINPDMKKTHAAMDVTRGDFYAVLALLKQSMDELGLPDDVQQRMLDTLRPMQRDIVNTP